MIQAIRNKIAARKLRRAAYAGRKLRATIERASAYAAAPDTFRAALKGYGSRAVQIDAMDIKHAAEQFAARAGINPAAIQYDGARVIVTVPVMGGFARVRF